MNILNKTMLQSPCYKQNIIIKPIGAFLHSVGCAQPEAQSFINAENRSTAKAGVHAFIDGKSNVHVTLPINFAKKTCVRNWHGGSGPKGNSNDTHIGIEMTEPASIKYTGGASFIDLDPEATKAFVLSTYKTAVEYFAYLCAGFDWNPSDPNVIMSHAEGHAKGIATNHHDVEHLWSKFGLTMDQFRKDVYAVKCGINTTVTTPAPIIVDLNPSVPAPVVTVENTNSSVNYTVEITTDSLNIRSKASASSDQVGTVKKGEIYTIVSESNDWGLLKSGAGWISLKYTKKNLPAPVATPTPVVPKPVDNTYKVKITVDSLRIRSKAVAGTVIGGAKKGEVYTIVKTSTNNWGQISSGGWISLEFTKRV